MARASSSPAPVKEHLEDILKATAEPVDVAIQLYLYCMDPHIFNDGNKRVAVIFVNHYLISKGGGLLVIPESHVPEFKRLLAGYYEYRDDGSIFTFMRKNAGKSSENNIGNFLITSIPESSLYSFPYSLKV